MKDAVSHRTTSLAGWVASLSIICSILVYSPPWPALAAGSLALAAAGLLALRRNLSIRPVLESDPMLAVAMQPAPRSARRAGLLPREKRTR